MTTPCEYPELRNLHLLKAMGITTYQPRYRLPGAAPSRGCNWPETEVASPVPGLTATLDSGTGVAAATASGSSAEVDHPPASSTPAARPVPDAILQDQRVVARSAKLALDEVPALAEKPQPANLSEQRVDAPAPGNHQSEVQAFQALLCPVNKQLSVLTLLPAIASPRLQENETLLLNNILRWLGMPALAPLVPHVFHWPLPGMKLNGLESAGRGLQAFLDQSAQEFGARRILVFGSLLQDCLEAAGDNSHGLQICATYSLNELLGVPELKREAWQTLLPVFQQLNGGASS